MAARQGGVVSRAQLIEAGLRAGGILRRVRAGRLHPVHPGVYAVGHRALGQTGREWAAVLAAGPGAALSHRSAGARLGIRPWSGRVELTVPRRHRPIDGVRLHRTRSLHPDDITLDEDGLPCTSWARTIVDLAELLSVHDLTRVLERSAVQRCYDGRALAAAMTRANGRRGLRTLLAALALGHHRMPQSTRSDLEELFLRVARGMGLRPRLNRWMQVSGVWMEADAWFPAERVVIELDSRWHDTAGARERDAVRDAALAAAGIGFARLRRHDLTEAHLRAVLSR
ncbi:MAG: type IV toxin-antitoxin system AbiEi family antitoxin domain-containing protein [Solirubrobacteraceae bacterium]